MTGENTNAKEILGKKKLFVFDMDGTIYLGERVFPEAAAFIRRLRENGKRVLFFTNNASRTPEFYMVRLSGMGFEPKRTEIMTSGDVTAAYLLSEREGKSVYTVGTPELVRSFRKAGIKVVGDDYGAVEAGVTPDIVVTSFDTTLTYEKLRNACTFIDRGAEYLSTHPDLNCPCEDGTLPDSGSIAAAVTASTGKVPTCFGKPEKTCADMIARHTGADKADILMIGDRLYTDIATGRRAGISTALVLTGETDEAMLDAAPEEQRPDFVFSDLGELSQLMFG